MLTAAGEGIRKGVGKTTPMLPKPRFQTQKDTSCSRYIQLCYSMSNLAMEDLLGSFTPALSGSSGN